jgi:carotenoid cleavage dioxygenase-like enzyme
MGGSGLLLWHVGADGTLRKTQVIDTPVRGYLHSFAMTDKHLIFMLMPYRYEAGEGAFFERLRFNADQPCRVAVVAKDALDAPRWFEVPFAAVYHFADAHERHGEIVVRAVQHPDIEEMRSPMKAAMSGHAPRVSHDRLLALHLNLRNGRARWNDYGVIDLEFPVFDPRTPADRAARLYAPTREGEARAPFFNAVAMLDPERGRREVYRYGSDILVEEHVFVPKPGSRRPDEGWLVGTLLDAERDRTGIAVLDARRVADGPLAQAWLPYSFPLGFHGHFAAR